MEQSWAKHLSCISLWNAYNSSEMGPPFTDEEAEAAPLPGLL